MSVNLLTSPNERDLFSSTVSCNECVSDIAEFNVNKIVKTVSLQAVTTPINDMVYTKQTMTYHQYGFLVMFSIDIRYSDKGASGSGAIYINLDGVAPLPEADNKQLVNSSIRLTNASGFDNLPRTCIVTNAGGNTPRIELSLSDISTGDLIDIPFSALVTNDGFINIQGHYFTD